MFPLALELGVGATAHVPVLSVFSPLPSFACARFASVLDAQPRNLRGLEYAALRGVTDSTNPIRAMSLAPRGQPDADLHGRPADQGRRIAFRDRDEGERAECGALQPVAVNCKRGLDGTALNSQRHMRDMPRDAPANADASASASALPGSELRATDGGNGCSRASSRTSTGRSHCPEERTRTVESKGT